MLSTLRRSPVIGARLGNRQAIQLRCYNKKRVNFDIEEEIHNTNKQIKKEKEKSKKLQARIDRLEAILDASGPKPESIDWSKAEIQIKSFEFQEPFLEREGRIEVFETYKNEFFSGTKEGMLCWTEEKDVNQRKSRLLTTVGVPGSGKTTFVKNMAAKVTEEGFLAVFVSYNEYSQPPCSLLSCCLPMGWNPNMPRPMHRQ